MLEAELASTDDSQIELQRAKDELRDTKEELAVAQGRIERLEKNAHRTVPVRRASRTYGQPPVLLSVSRSSSRAGAPTKRMTSSKSLKRIHGMLDQMKNLESRVATFKSTLPKPVAVNTPSKHHLTSPPLHSNTASPVPRYRASQDHLSEFAQTHHGHHYSPSTASIPSTSSRSKRNSFSLEPGLGSGTAATPTDLHRSQSSASRSASSNHVVVPRTARSPRTRHSVDMMSSLSIADQHQHYSQKHHNSSAINLGTTTTTDNTTPTKQHRFNGSFYTHHKMASTTSVTSSGSQQQHHHPSFGVLHSRQSATLSHGTRMWLCSKRKNSISTFSVHIYFYYTLISFFFFFSFSFFGCVSW